MTDRCPECGETVASADDVINRSAPYGNSQGGHFDRHKLVDEAIERILASAED